MHQGRLFPAGRPVGRSPGLGRAIWEGPRPGWHCPRPRQRCPARLAPGPSPVQRVKEWKDSMASSCPGAGGSRRTPLPLLSPPGRAPGRRQPHPLAVPSAEADGGPERPPGPAWPWSVKALQTRLSARAPRILCRRVGPRFSGYFGDSWSYRQIWQKLKKPKEQHTG